MVVMTTECPAKLFDARLHCECPSFVLQGQVCPFVNKKDHSEAWLINQPIKQKEESASMVTCMLINSKNDQNRSFLPMGPTGLWWNFPLRSACSTLCKSSGTQEPNSLSLLLRLPWRSRSCLWTASTLWFASVRSVLWGKKKMAQLVLA